MADISFNIACKELKIAQIAQLNQLFQVLYLVHISRPRLLWVKPYANEEKCKRWPQQRFALSEIYAALRKAFEKIVVTYHHSLIYFIILIFVIRVCFAWTLAPGYTLFCATSGWTIMEASVSVTDVKSYRSYSIERRGVCQIFSVSDAVFISKSDFWIRIHHWCSSVSKDYGVVLWLVVLERRLVWLERPIREW